MKTWYTTTKKDDLQGLVCDEQTGENIAVTYKAENASLVAAAPEMLEALENTIFQIDFDRSRENLRRQQDYLVSVIKKAKGE